MKDLDYTPDVDLAQRIRDCLPRRRPQDGDIIYWVVLDPETGEACARCNTRREARELAGPDGDIGKLLRAH